MANVRAATDLDTVRSFLNTLDLDTDEDRLADAGAFTAWLAEAGLAGADAPIDADTLELARELRATLRDLARANHDGAPDPDATARLNTLADRFDVVLRFTASGEVELAGEGEGPTAALATIVAATAAAVADDRWRRVKLCRSDDCEWAFYDASRNRSGRWCTMAVCGNRQKARAFRSRHEGEATPAGDA